MSFGCSCRGQRHFQEQRRTPTYSETVRRRGGFRSSRQVHRCCTTRIAVIGLGYVGLPLAVELARHFPTTGFDIDAGRIAELRGGHDRTREVDPDDLRGGPLALTSDTAELPGMPALHRDRPDAGGRQEPARPWGGPGGLPHRRRGAPRRHATSKDAERSADRRVRKHRLSRRYGGYLRPGPGRGVGTGLRTRFLPGLLPGTHQSRRPRAHDFPDHEGDRRPDRRGHGTAGGGLRRRHQRRRLPCRRHQGGGSRQGDRERPARHQHRLHQRSLDDLRPPRHLDPRRAGSVIHQMELPELPPRHGRRPLHRGRSLLSGASGDQHRPPAGSDPGRTPDQRDDAGLYRRPDRRAHRGGRDGRPWRAVSWCWD